MIKDSKYKLSGKIHRNGIEAISWHIRLVVANNMTDAASAKIIQTNGWYRGNLVAVSLLL